MKAITRTQSMGIILIIIVIAVGIGYYVTRPPPVPVAPTERKLVHAIIDFLGNPDPHIGTAGSDMWIQFNCYDSLVAYDDETPPNIIPWLAEEWDISADGLTYTFTLRENVKFHSGNEVTAQTVQYSMDRILRMQQGFVFLWDGLLEPGDIEAVNKYTTRFNLRKPFAPFLATMLRLQVVDPAVIEEHIVTPGPYGDYGDYANAWLMEGHDAGSGPYILTDWLKDVSATYRYFPDYFMGWKENQIAERETILVTEEATQRLLMEEGKVDVAGPALSAEFNDYMRTESTVNKLVVDPGGSIFNIYFNTQKPPLDDVHVRKALAYILDSEMWATDIMGIGDPLSGPLPSAMLGYIPLESYSTNNVEKAQEELAKSKYDVTEMRELTFAHFPYENWRRVALLFQSLAAEIGITVKLEPTPFPVYMDMLQTLETTPDMSAVINIITYYDPDTYLYTLYHTSPYHSWSINPMWYSNQTVDALLEEARVKFEWEERKAIYEEVQRIIHDQVPAIFGVTWNYQVPMSRQLNVEGITNNVFPSSLAWHMYNFYKYTWTE